jgi:hypothetical protein
MGMFVHLFVPQPKTKGGQPVFNFTLLLDEEAQKSDAWKACKIAVAAAIDAEFKGSNLVRDAAFMKNFRLPWQDAAEKKQYTGFTPGKIFIAPWTKTKPGIVDGNLQDVTVPSDVWAGQLMRATMTAFAYTHGANRGANFMLNNVQITKADMPRMDGRTNAGNDFDRTDGGGTDANDDDNIPF